MNVWVTRKDLYMDDRSTLTIKYAETGTGMGAQLENCANMRVLGTSMRIRHVNITTWGMMFAPI